MRVRHMRFAAEGGLAGGPCEGTSGSDGSAVAVFAFCSSMTSIALPFRTLRQSAFDDREQKFAAGS
jgi:hypothetical protein